VLVLFLQKILKAYMEFSMFSQQTLSLITTLARLIMLFAFVIQPAFYFFIDYFAANSEVSESVGILSWLGHINIIAYTAGYGLHVTSAAHKVAREIEDEQNLTI
jgi:hypothetical protein